MGTVKSVLVQWAVQLESLKLNRLCRRNQPEVQTRKVPEKQKINANHS